jgi:hypothetical protein
MERIVLFKEVLIMNSKRQTPFVLCAANGTIVEIYGFYNAKQNDAKIMEDILEKD